MIHVAHMVMYTHTHTLLHTHAYTYTHTEGALTWLQLFSGAFPASAAE